MSDIPNGNGKGLQKAPFSSALGLLGSIATISALRATSPSSANAVESVVVLNHSEVDDGGGGIFVWKPDETLDDNNGTIVEPTGWSGDGRWVRHESLMYQGYINVCWFGAREGVGADNSDAFNDAITALPLYGDEGELVCPSGRQMRRGTLFVPAGTYYVSDTILASGGMRFMGDGAKTTAIRLNANATGFQDPNSPKWVLQFEKSDAISNNNVFGTCVEQFALYGGCTAEGGSNDGCSGIDIVKSAQGSYCRDLIASGFGVRGVNLEVPGDNLWITNCLIGPAVYCTSSPTCLHRNLMIEHVNEGALHTMLLKDGVTSIPVPSCYFKDCRGLVIDCLQGEGSNREVVFDSCQNVTVRRMSFNGPGADPENGHTPTMVSIYGDSYEFYFGPTDIQGAYGIYYKDESDLAVTQGLNGTQPNNYAPRSIIRSSQAWLQGNHVMPGPFSGDGDAEDSGVPVGAVYSKSDGSLAVRLS